MRERDLDFTIERLGDCRVPSPMTAVRFVRDDERVLHASTVSEVRTALDGPADLPAMEMAGPRARLFFEPSTLACGIVTCGGLCPGLNDVIRSLVLSLYHHYGVTRVYGFRFGYEGLVPRHGHEPLQLTPQGVNRIHSVGGTILGSSRGHQEPAEMVDGLRDLGIGILFAIGGDGTLRGAKAIADEAARQRLALAVVGIPKTIDNDVAHVQKTFGFETAVSEARRATSAAGIEAEGALNGVGLVKLMGRDSGFIAAYTVLVDGQVNFCLVPEVPFSLERFLSELKCRLDRRRHAMIVIAEGVAANLAAGSAVRDASGNMKYPDVGLFLRDAIAEYFKRIRMPITLRYIDPSYAIRSVPANAHDSAFCLMLGHCAVHAGMAGRTNMVVGFWNHQFTHVPIALATAERKKIDPEGFLWSSVLASTGQPADMR
jgi:6-phosphofructokinase 1